MYVVMNELHVPKEAKETMIQRFEKSVEHMKEVDGLIEYLFLNNEKEDGKLVVFTKWESKEAYQNWVESDAFKNAHKQKRESKEQTPGNGNEVNMYTVVYHV